MRFSNSLWPQAQARGVSRTTFDAAFAGLGEDPSIPAAIAAQPEFEQPISAYFAEAVSPTRIAKGRALAQRYRGELATIERRYGVPRAILLAAWGMESDFGRDRGDKDVIRSLATLAFRRTQNDRFVDELLSALVILEKHALPRDKLRGSWAGAMGDPQFLPSAFLKYAVSYSGDRFPDIWNRPEDTLSSIGDFFHASGWNAALPWGARSGPAGAFRFCDAACRFSRICCGGHSDREWSGAAGGAKRPCFFRRAPAARRFC